MNIIPVEFNVVVAIDTIEEKTAGGIFLPESVKESNDLKCEEGTLVAVSPHAFTYADWPEGSRVPAVGDKVLVARFAGVLRERDGKKYRILKDKDVIAILDTPTAVAAAA